MLLNTCCIRENADNKLYGHLGHLAAEKQKRPEMQIAVAGCLAQKDARIVREKAPHDVGAMQLFIEADARHFLGESSSRSDTWIRVALFDVIANNADRKSGHCLFDATDKVWVIDHGLTFHVDQKLRTVIWDFSGEPLPGDLCGDVERTLVEVERGGLGKTMQGLVSQAEMRVLKRRLRAVLDPRWRFPEPSSAWSIPWPPV